MEIEEIFNEWLIENKKQFDSSMNPFEMFKAGYTQALQLQQTGVIKSVCDCAKDEFCCRCHESKGWKIENGKYVKQTVL